MRNKLHCLSFAVAAFLTGTALALPAPKQIVPEERLTRKERREYYEKLSKQGWSPQDFKRALNVCRGSQPLLDKFIDLRNQKVPPGYIERSFHTVKGAPQVAQEYWEYVLKWHFHPREVDWVFRNFPPNRIVRWHYFEYRTGGLIDPSDKKAKRERPFSRQECMAIFPAFRCDMNFIKRYFDERRKGASRLEAFRPLYQELLEKIKKEREEARKKEEERRKLLAEKTAQHTEVLRVSKPTTEQEEEAAAKKEKKDDYVVLSQDELEKLLQIMDKEESEEEAAEAKKADKDDKEEPSEEEARSEEEPEEETEPESEEAEQ